MEEVRKLLKQAFDLALDNGVVINSVEFKHFTVENFGPAKSADVHFRSIKMDCSMICFDEDQPV